MGVKGIRRSIIEKVFKESANQGKGKREDDEDEFQEDLRKFSGTWNKNNKTLNKKPIKTILDDDDDEEEIKINLETPYERYKRLRKKQKVIMIKRKINVDDEEIENIRLKKLSEKIIRDDNNTPIGVRRTFTTNNTRNDKENFTTGETASFRISPEASQIVKEFQNYIKFFVVKKVFTKVNNKGEKILIITVENSNFEYKENFHFEGNVNSEKDMKQFAQFINNSFKTYLIEWRKENGKSK